MNRLDFYFCALAILYLSFTGTFTIGMPSMSRYTLPVIVLGLLGFLHLLSRNQEIEFFKKFSELTMPTAIVFFAPLHVMYVHHYIIGHGWVY